MTTVMNTATPGLERKPHLRKLGWIDQPQAVEVENVEVNPDTLGDHRLIAFETGVLPLRVRYGDDTKSTIDVYVKVSDLKREGYSTKEYKSRLNAVLIPRADVIVVNDSELED